MGLKQCQSRGMDKCGGKRLTMIEACQSPLTAELTTPLQLLLFYPSPPALHNPPLPSLSSSLQQSQAALLSVSSLPDSAAVVKQRGKREREERFGERKKRRGDSERQVVADWTEQ